jgi:glycosyltransferase involved in cell wall biosynthesis
MNKPRFSIITPLHNKGPYITETIASVQSQTFSHWQLIIVENHSSDDGPLQVERAAAADARISLVHAPKDVRGPAAARNIGLALARGDWILFLDADDILDSRYLDQMNRMQSLTPEAVVITSPWVEFRNDILSSEKVIKYPVGFLNNGIGVQELAIAFTCWAVHAAIIRRSWLSERKWPEELDGYLAEDTAFWFRVVSGARIAYSEFPGAYYRTHTECCRTNLSADSWFEGNHHAVLSNLEWLRSHHQSPSNAQVLMLVRLYESLYERAEFLANNRIVEKALKLANVWLSRLPNKQTIKSPSMTLRKLFGIRTFCRLKKSLFLITRGHA